MAFGNTRSSGPWRHPDIDNSTPGIRERLIRHAQTAEAGSLDALFFADGLNYGPPATWAYKTTEDFEPLTTPAALSSVTENIGLVVTGSATLQHPYHLARQLLSLDHLSGGRAGWNLVTSFARAAADNFSARGVSGTGSQTKRSRWSRNSGTHGISAPSWKIVSQASSMTLTGSTCQTTTASTSTSGVPSAPPARHRGNR